jgi:hypothetical protein
MPRPARRTKNPPLKTPTRLRQAASQVAVDADQVRQDLNKLLKSLEHLSVEALREVSNRALALIDEKNGEVQRSFIGGLVGSAVRVGESIAGLVDGSEPAPKKRRRGRRGPGAE